MSKIIGLNWNLIDNYASKSRVRSSIEALMLNDKREIQDNYGFEDGNWNLTDIITTRFRYKLPALQMICGEDEKGNHIPSMAINVRFRLKVHCRQVVYCDKDNNVLKAANISPDAKPLEGDVIRWKNIPRPSDTGTGRNTKELRRWQTRGEDSYKYKFFTIDSDGCIIADITFAHPMLQKFGKRLVYPEFKGKGDSRSVGNNWVFEEVSKDYTVNPPMVKKVGRPKKEIQDE